MNYYNVLKVTTSRSPDDSPVMVVRGPAVVREFSAVGYEPVLTRATNHAADLSLAYEAGYAKGRAEIRPSTNPILLLAIERQLANLEQWAVVPPESVELQLAIEEARDAVRKAGY